MDTGKIIHYNVDRGYGFVRILDGSREEFFFHINESLYRNIKEGDKVSFTVVKSRNKPGTLCAVDLNLITDGKG